MNKIRKLKTVIASKFKLFGIVCSIATLLLLITLGLYYTTQHIKSQPVGRAATVVVAAHNSSLQSKAQADIVVDGVDDQVEIQAAIDALGPRGGKVLLMEGTFIISDQIHMRSRVNLEGIGWASTIKLRDGLNIPAIWPMIIGRDIYDWRIASIRIDCNRRGQVFADWIRHYTIGIRITGSSSVTIYNVLVENGGTGIDSGPGVNNHIIISNNHVRDMYPGDGIGTNHLRYSTIIGNTTTNTREEGIDLHNVHHTTVMGNTIHNVTVSHGIGLRFDSTHNVIVGNILTNVPRHGIFIQGTVEIALTGTIIANNSIKNAGLSGIFARYASHTLIEGNIIEYLGQHGINLHSVLGSIVKSNIIRDTVFASIRVSNCPDSVFTNNNIKRSGCHGIIIAGSPLSLVVQNHIRNVFGHGIVLIDSDVTNIMGNTVMESGQGGGQEGISVRSASAGSLITGNLIRQGTLINRSRYGIHIRAAVAPNIVIRDNDLRDSGMIAAIRDDTGTAIYSTQHTEHHIDVFAASDVHIRAAIIPDGLTHTSVTSPDVPRNIMIRITNTDGANPQTPSGGNIVVHGINARGFAVFETLSVPATSISAGRTSDVFGVVAFARVTSIDYYPETNTNITVSVGISNRIGLGNSVYTSEDVFKVTRNGVCIIRIVDPTNDTINLTTIIAGDDITIWHRESINILE